MSETGIRNQISGIRNPWFGFPQCRGCGRALSRWKDGFCQHCEQRMAELNEKTERRELRAAFSPRQPVGAKVAVGAEPALHCRGADAGCRTASACCRGQVGHERYLQMNRLTEIRATA